IDDANMGNNYDILYNLTLDEIDEIYINQGGLGYGATAGGGIIRIYRTKNSKKNSTRKIIYTNDFIIENGFSTEKEFYIPQFYSFSKSNFLKYATINWKPNITTDANGRISYNI